MIQKIKNELVNNEDKLIQVLEYYGFCKFHNINQHLRFAYDETGGQNNVCIRLFDNDNCYVKDYVRTDYSGDIFAYICKARHYEFKEVFNTIRNMLGITDIEHHAEHKKLFGGFFNSIAKKTVDISLKELSEDVLLQYQDCYVKKFLDDGVSKSSHDKFHIGLDLETNRITIPIYDSIGRLVGIKGRCNYDTEEEPKYVYLYPCAISQCLYGYHQNYSAMYNNRIYVFEAEKSVMQCNTFGVHNAVAMCSSSLTDKQARLLIRLQPTEIVFMLDKDLEKEKAIANAERVRKYSFAKEIELYWWNWNKDNLFPKKASPSDLGKEMFVKALENIERI